MPQTDEHHALSRQECLHLLTTVPFGRIVYTLQALPAVLPVGFALDNDGSILLRTSAASRLVHAVDSFVVAFEADEIDIDSRCGWSVIVTGQADVVTDPAERERLSHSAPHPWVDVQDSVLIRIQAHMVTGRRLASRPVVP
ncbi:pyridoxamine 5'-phosphate oxidase family protein [Streptomyces sp. NPDC050085]|uniref:pyridoxamine 5'-phosphate oxidase family protein n=1 Tax=Streptomyces sp. NPDC050085 TaxID=3365600 RepID=UPI0037B4CF34